MGKGTFLVSCEKMRDLLHLPDNAEIYFVRFRLEQDQVEFFVRHPDIEPSEVQVVPRVYPSYSTETVGYTRSHFKGWGQP